MNRISAHQGSRCAMPDIGKIMETQAKSFKETVIEEKLLQSAEEIVAISEVGFFQVEEVLIPKIKSSPAKHLVELRAGVIGEPMKRYI